MADKALNGNKIPIKFELGSQLIDGAVIKPLTYALFVEFLTEAQTMKAPKSFDARLRRLRLRKQITYYTNGSAVNVSEEDVLKMPIPTVHALTGHMDDEEGKAGKVTTAGNGIDKAIVYELGKPIPMGKDKEPITELEFYAKTYGEIEDVLAAPDSIQQAALLISTIAKPLGTTLLQLPSWAVSQISMADGLLISREVLPHFLGSPVE